MDNVCNLFQKILKDGAGRRSLICKSIVGKISPKLRGTFSKIENAQSREIGAHYHQATVKGKVSMKRAAKPKFTGDLFHCWVALQSEQSQNKKLIN